MRIKSIRKWYPVEKMGLFMSGPVIVFTYSHLPLVSVLDYYSIILAIFWLYMSAEDTLSLSVPAPALYFSSSITLIFAIIQQREIADYILIASFMACIFCTVWITQRLKNKSLIGSADYVVIVSLGFTLHPHTLGLWLIIACAIPLISVALHRKVWAKKIPFIPYLTASWLLVSTLN